MPLVSASIVRPVAQSIALDASKGAQGPAFGPELITNGGFDVDANWTKGGNWTIANGVATHAPGSSGNLDQAKALTVGAVYMLSFTVTARAAGSISPQFTGGSVVAGTARTTPGTYSQLLTAISGNNNLRFVSASAGDFSIDNVSLRRKYP
jgi:hypothetical protein